MLMQKDKDLLNILAHKLFSASSANFDEERLGEMLEEADQQAVLPFVMSDVKECVKRNACIEQYQCRNARYEKNNILNLYYHHLLHQCLREEGIPYVIIKGAASAYYYREPLLRCSGDVDFLIKEQDKLKVDELLRKQGFIKNPGADKHEFHWSYHKKDIELEMHWDLPGLPEKGKDRIHKYMSDLFEQSFEVPLGNYEMVVPNKFHHGVIILLHAISHLTGGGIGLRHLCDWLVFENNIGETEFIELFKAPFMEMGLWKCAKVLTQIGVLYLGCEERAWCDDVEDDLCQKLLEDIMDSGNFGYKNDLRKSQSKLFRKNDTGVVGQNNWISNLLANINYRTSRKHVFLYRSIIFRPIGWICVCTEYLLLLLFGKRNNIMNKELLNGAKTRQKVYEALCLLEPEED